jgi:hypothetical protein
LVERGCEAEGAGVALAVLQAEVATVVADDDLRMTIRGNRDTALSVGVTAR